MRRPHRAVAAASLLLMLMAVTAPSLAVPDRTASARASMGCGYGCGCGMPCCTGMAGRTGTCPMCCRRAERAAEARGRLASGPHADGRPSGLCLLQGSCGGHAAGVEWITLNPAVPAPRARFERPAGPAGRAPLATAGAASRTTEPSIPPPRV